MHLWALILIPAFAIIGHIRGQWNEVLPGPHPRFWCAPVVGLLAWTVLAWPWALYFAACWLVFHMLAWGRWYDMGHWDSDVRKPPGLFERAIEIIPGGDFAHFLVRNTVCVLPAIALNPVMALIAPLVTAAYWLGWKIKPKQGNWPAEFIAGGLWGAALALLANI